MLGLDGYDLEQPICEAIEGMIMVGSKVLLQIA